ncbi:uncharacterized protein EDB91DRAFT_1337587 [Suillus paluster]|uniref:uncharacterized protein n=1 Tax=Suillus paluster TaxID=48578 RepID=UPI001B8733DB|nr:uncharacterized protein EDB91DRAFT_1337587 [Suillus paluster]KAG1735717.1 hypothetical protein EDB91DRAFT_1337587 [Suillus paluster]
MPPININTSSFKLDAPGIAGFFGGEEAVLGMQTIHLYEYRKWLGWYNSPGGWTVGKFGTLANSRFWNTVFPGLHEGPTKLFGFDGKQGPKYVASRSGSSLEHTGHLAYLITQSCKEPEVQVEGGLTKRIKVTIIQTQPNPSVKENRPVRTIPPGRHVHVAILPMAVSFITCALCGWTYDWFCCVMILLGIVSNGLFTLVIGSACLGLKGMKSSQTAPPGDGMLMDGDDIIILLGTAGNVGTITRGQFVLEYEPWVKKGSREEKRKCSVPGDGMGSASSNRGNDADEYDEYAAIGLCSLLLVIQLLSQALLIPQGTLFFGQIMFLSSIAASWVYNFYLSSMDKECIQQRLLLDVLDLHMQPYSPGKRTTAVVFACLMLQPRGNDADEWESFKPAAIIQHLIPNDTQVWITWRQKVLGVISERERNQEACYGLLQVNAEDEARMKKDDIYLLEQLLVDARTAYDQATAEQRRLGSIGGKED